MHLCKFGFRSEVKGNVFLRTELPGAGTSVSFLSAPEICFRRDFDDFVHLPDWLPRLPFTSSSEVGGLPCLIDTVGTG